MYINAITACSNAHANGLPLTRAYSFIHSCITGSTVPASIFLALFCMITP